MQSNMGPVQYGHLYFLKCSTNLTVATITCLNRAENVPYFTKRGSRFIMQKQNFHLTSIKFVIESKNPISCCEATMYLSSEDLSRNNYFVLEKLSKSYYLFHLFSVPSVIFLFDIKITPHTNRKMSQATSHCLKYIFLPFL